VLKFKVIGSGEYLRKGLAYLFEKGLAPSEDAELLVCLAHPEILRKDTLEQYPKGCINFHCGLPNYRGRHPLQWMLIDGVPEIPCAVHFMDEGVDTGRIVAEDVVAVDRNETYATALEKVTNTVGPLVVKAMTRIEKEGYVGRLQDRIVPVMPRRNPDMSAVSFNHPSRQVHCFINALADPMPNAFWGEKKFKQSFSGSYPGEVIAETTDGRQVIATLDGVVLVKPA
jgi:methionyl-tRNA formyltransferase